MATVLTYPDSRAVSGRSFAARYAMESDMKTQTPPLTLKSIVDAIATRRGVTLYKETE
jgi:hypothetical protein